MPPRPRVLRLAQLVLGLFGWALAVSLYVRAGLGLGPWDAFHYGLHLQTGLTIGQASISMGLVILVASRFLGVKPGLGTIANMVLIGLFVDLLLPRLPEPGGLPTSVAYFGLAISLTGVCSGMYIGAGFGAGPRDSLMVALARRSGRSVRRIRTFIEATALSLGWLMGGTVGVGTLIIVLTIGTSVQWGLRLFDALPAREEDEQAPAPRTPRRRWRLRKAA